MAFVKDYLYFKTFSGDYFEIKIESYRVDFLINFNLIQLSSGKYRSVDRGEITDRYSTTFKFNTTTTYIGDMMRELKLLRDNNQDIIMGGFTERIFGDNINHDNEIHCLLEKVGKQESNGLHTGTIELTFLLTNPIYIPDTGLPESIKCLESGWKGYSEWNTHINESYNRNNWFVDKVVDTYIFNGTYIMSEDDTAKMINYWRIRRGEAFSISDGDFGVQEMFGPNGGTGNHIVLITNLSYTRLSPIYRTVKIEMVKES